MKDSLLVIAYHYVRDPQGTPFPGIKGLSPRAFEEQIDAISRVYEWATLETALACWRGQRRCARPMALLTFDDGLSDHYRTVFPALKRRGIQGVFFLITSCVEGRTLLAVHRNQLLLASTPFAEYREQLLAELRRLAPALDESVPEAEARAAYRWDEPEVARFKYFLAYLTPAAAREAAVRRVFERRFADEAAVARDLYLDWDQAKEMQEAGMVIGGHSHRHAALATMSLDEQRRDITACAALLKKRLGHQAIWPFAYPYGKRASFTAHSAGVVAEAGFSCAFSFEREFVTGVSPEFALPRRDPKDALASESVR